MRIATAKEVLKEEGRFVLSMQMKDHFVSETATSSVEEKKQNAQGNSKFVIVLVLTLSLILALSTVLLVPLFVDGAEVTTASSGATLAPAQPRSSQSFEAMSDAVAVLGFTPSVPNTTPDGYQLKEIRVLDGDILELEYVSDQDVLLFRTALGAEDLSLTDTSVYAFTLSDEDGSVVRSYLGESQEELYLAIWAQEEASYALLSEKGLNESDMASIAGNIA